MGKLSSTQAMKLFGKIGVSFNETFRRHRIQFVTLHEFARKIEWDHKSAVFNLSLLSHYYPQFSKNMGRITLGLIHDSNEERKQKLSTAEIMTGIPRDVQAAAENHLSAFRRVKHPLRKILVPANWAFEIIEAKQAGTLAYKTAKSIKQAARSVA